MTAEQLCSLPNYLQINNAEEPNTVYIVNHNLDDLTGEATGRPSIGAGIYTYDDADRLTSAGSGIIPLEEAWKYER